ncbi:hypothetical protein B0H19DRAFT_416273 [Mycena capillaripes]|nr:hypothetical protein B0H19DRAFT_416273 [Mycena capillaripes]
MHTVHQIAMTPDVVVFMGKATTTRKLQQDCNGNTGRISKIIGRRRDFGHLCTEHSLLVCGCAYAVGHHRRDVHQERSRVHCRRPQGQKYFGIGRPHKSFSSAVIISPSFKDTYEVNVFGTVAVTEAIRPLMNNGGGILNISSRLGSTGVLAKDSGIPSAPPYSSSKSALNNLTVHWALREKKNGSGIRVVSISPGIFYHSPSCPD